MKNVIAVLALAFATAPVAVGQQEIAGISSVWDGIVTAAQANRGQAVADSACGSCHRLLLNGAPACPAMRCQPPPARPPVPL